MNARLDQHAARSASKPTDDEPSHYADIAQVARSLPLNVRRFLLIVACCSLACSVYFLNRYGAQTQGLSAVFITALIALAYLFIRMNKGLAAARQVRRRASHPDLGHRP